MLKICKFSRLNNEHNRRNLYDQLKTTIFIMLTNKIFMRSKNYDENGNSLDLGLVIILC